MILPFFQYSTDYGGWPDLQAHEGWNGKIFVLQNIQIIQIHYLLFTYSNFLSSISQMLTSAEWRIKMPVREPNSFPWLIWPVAS